MRDWRLRWFGLCAAGLIARTALAVQPISYSHDLVAGQGAAGYRDGEFYRALFNGPTGLSVSPDRSRLFVADRENHRIRVVHLADRNRVETLAGSGRRGRDDGNLEQSSFDGPTGVVAVSDSLVIVSDEGNALFRSLDLKTGVVKTLAGNGARGIEEGGGRSVPLGGVWNMLFVPSEDALYFSQPDYQALRRLDLKSNAVTTVLREDPRLLKPTALALFQGKLCVADGGGAVYSVETELQPDGKPGPAALKDIARGGRILAMAESGGRLYALEVGSSRLVCLSTGKPVPLLSVSGDVLEESAEWFGHYWQFDGSVPVGFVADPGEQRSFFLAAPSLESVLRVKDHDFLKLRDTVSTNPDGLMDFEYPRQKPTGTFRVLLVGDSHLYQEAEAKAPGRVFSRMQTLPKRLELMLSTLAALDHAAVVFEVLTLARTSWEPLPVWACYEVPRIVEQYDVDLVLLMTPPETSTVTAYLERPITGKGIPAAVIDPEYLLTPWSERIRKNPARKLVERSQALGWAHSPDRSQVYLEPISTLVGDLVAREEVLNLFARPLRELDRTLKSIGLKRGRAVLFEVCYYTSGTRGWGSREQDLWKDLCAREHIGLLDLMDPIVALRETYFPLSDVVSFAHFTVQGHEFIAFLLAHELVRQGIVPFDSRR
jgi:hypothetical protein